MTPEPIPHLLTMDALAETLGTSHRHLRRLIAEQRIPYLKVGGRIRFDPSEVNAWLDTSRRAVVAVGKRDPAGRRTDAGRLSPLQSEQQGTLAALWSEDGALPSMTDRREGPSDGVD